MMFTDLYDRLVLWWQSYAYPTQEMSELLTVALLGVVSLLVLGLWLRFHQDRRHPMWVPVSATLSVVLMVPVVMHLQAANYGSSDTRCHLYGGGQITYELLRPPILLPTDPGDPFSSEVLVLLVRAEERWGSKLHTCSLARDDERAKQLIRSFAEMPMETAFNSSSGGTITFSFGNGREVPNVTFEPDYIPELKGPPEKPDEAL